MKLIQVAILLIVATIPLAHGNRINTKSPFRTGEISLTLPWRSHQTRIDTFMIPLEYHEGDRFALNFIDFNIKSNLSEDYKWAFGWEIKMIEQSNNFTLEVTEPSFNQDWAIIVRYLVINKEILQTTIFLQNLKLNDLAAMKSLDNSNILTVSSESQDLMKREEVTKQVMILHRGFQTKGEGIKPQMILKGHFVDESHIHIVAQLENIRYCFITLIIIDQPSLSINSWEIFVSNNFEESQSQFYQMPLIKEAAFEKCSNQNNKSCWQIETLKEAMIFRKMEQNLQVQTNIQHYFPQDEQSQKFSLYGRNRLLSDDCEPSSCSCSPFPHASVCFEDNNCKCKIKKCDTGYYTTANLVATCTQCTIANCVSCTLPFGGKIPVCTACSAGYVVLNGACALCPLGCSSCAAIMIATISCTTCSPTLTLQTSGSIKLCGCLSNQFMNYATTPVTCVTCPVACLTCNAGPICTTCVTGYYLQSPSCLACMPVCKTCSAASTCLTCPNTVFTMVGGVCTCPAPLFFNTATKTCLACSSIISNCATCSYSGAYIPSSPPTVVCSIANSGYYISGNGSVIACISYCSNCDFTPAPVCSTPKVNFTYDGVSCVCSPSLYFTSSGTCLDCSTVIPGCLSCQTNVIPTATQCISCDSSGYFSPTAYPSSTCTACPSLCLTCSALNACITCVNNLAVLGTGVCGCDNGLGNFLQTVTKTCMACSSIVFSCQTCNGIVSPVICSTCSSGFYLSGATCTACPSTCSTCANGTYCTGCEPGYDLVGNLCVCGANCTSCMGNSTDGFCSACTYSMFSCSNCIVGYYLNGGNNCSSCSIFPSCSECTSFACITCATTFVLDTSLGCVCNNNGGLYLTLDSLQCLSCSSVIANCISCTQAGSTTCLSCSNGYYVSNLTACSPCTGNCLTCSVSSSFCGSCLITYSMVSPNTCACDNAAALFYNPATGGCSLCTTLLANCQTCGLNATNQTICSTCINQFYWNTALSVCSQCPSTCYTCTSPSFCSVCQPGFVLSGTIGWAITNDCVCDNSTVPTTYLDTSGTCQTCSFIIPGCTSCTDNGTLICNGCIASTYPVGNTCLNCPSSCATCDATGCLTCPGNLTLSSGTCVCGNSCIQCQTLSANCLSCLITASAITACYACQPGTYLASPSCNPCPSTCATCSSPTSCLTCQPTYELASGACSCANSIGRFADSTGICVACSQIYYACTQCSMSGGSTVCSTCSSGYFLSGTSCLPCNSNCLTCSTTATTCDSCPVGQTLSANKTCACSTASCIACNVVSPNCVQCVYTIYGNFSQCSTCLSGFYVNGANCSPCPSECVTCGAGGACLTCATTFEVINSTCLCNQAMNLWESGSLCVSCTSLYPNCQTCVQDTGNAFNVSCSLCINGYFNLNNTCTPSVCGDGIITSGQTCDDGNANKGDGCSDFCQAETNFICTGQPSSCVVNVNFKIILDSIQTSKTTCNKVSISFRMNEVYDSYKTANFQNMLGYFSQSNLVYNSWTYSSGVVTYNFDYTSTLTNVFVDFYFTPALLVIQTITLPIITVNIQLKPTNNIALIYYKEQVCKSKENIQALTKTMQYASYATLIASALPCKIVGLELFGVLQLAHINVGNMDSVNTLMAPLMGMKGVQGFAMNMGDQSAKSSRLLQSSAYTPSRVQSIGYQSNFLRNCNVMLFIVITVVLVAAILYSCTYFCKSCAPSLHSISKRIIKEVLLTLILFNCYNFAYSAGIHFNYAPTNDSLYTIGTVAAVLSLVLPLIMAIGLMCSQDEGFGEYKQKFKPGIVERLYFVVTILYRTGIGLYISTMNEDSMSTLIVMALSIAFLLYNLVNLPYAKAYHNYRANICHFTQFVCLFVAMYYRNMMSSTSETAMANVYTPVYVQLTCIALSLVVSMVVLFYEIYLFVSECMQKKGKKISSEASIDGKHNTTEEGNLVLEKQKNYSIEGLD